MKRNFIHHYKLKTIVWFSLCVFFSNPVSSQNWQWAKRGGSGNSVVPGIPWESVLDLASDDNGNVYFLAHAKTPNYTVDTASFTGNGQQDLILGSFSCKGKLRWSKILGGTNNDISSSMYHSLMLDEGGRIYVAGFMSPPPAFDTDTVMEMTAKRVFLVQYDTSGIFQWLRMPQPDTVTHAFTNRYRFLDMDVDEQGNVYYFVTFNAGQLTGTSIELPVIGPYIIIFDAQGNITDVITLDMQVPLSTNVSAKIKRDPVNGNFYIAGQYNAGNFSINGEPITKGAYVAAFNAQGGFLWKKENNTNINAGFVSRPALDDDGNIYIGGMSSHGDVFDGFPITNTLVNHQTGLPLLVKINANGTTSWVRNGSVNAATYGGAVAVRGNEVLFTGSYPGTLVWPNEDTVSHVPNQGYDIFLAFFNLQTGTLNKLDTLASLFGGHEHPGALEVDAMGNIYLGGEFGSHFYVGDDTLLSHGGQSDFFIAKYGMGCECAAPNPSFSYSASTTAPELSFLYTGSANVDSLHWDFGDGQASTDFNPVHAFPGNGNYQVCLEAYNNCGVNITCSSVVINCPPPLSSFNYFQSGFTVNFQYSGSSADSVRWNFGDGQEITSHNPTHIYGTNGNYTVCARAYNPCGSDVSCQLVLLIVNIADIDELPVNIYPNPSSEFILIDGLKQPGTYRMNNAVGEVVLEGSISPGNHRIIISELPAGIYIIEIKHGKSFVRKKVLVKNRI